MVDYAGINFYMNNFGGGTVEAAAFHRLVKKATLIIKNYAGTNVDESNIPDEVQYCCCDIIQILLDAESKDKEHGGVKSESVGGWSKTYEDSSTADAQLNAKIEKSVLLWLSGTGLLYRGVRS